MDLTKKLWIGGVNMANSCGCNNECHHRGGSGFLIIIVLYILLAIILGSCLF